MIDFPFGDRLKADLFPRVAPSMLQWATENVVIPDGPYRGQPFDPDIQPFARTLLDAIDGGRWQRVVIVGPSQSGKTFLGFAIPTLYHLFGIGETVVCGLPTLDMVNDKWREALLPVIESSPRLRSMLPRMGSGARGGQVKAAVRFTNGSTLRFMTAGGSDKSRAGFSARVLVVTEADAIGATKRTSDEADPLRQLEARTRAYLRTGTRVYLESTCSTTEGRIWTEYLGGSQSRIVRPCPRCGAFVTPERESLSGWQDAENELQARTDAAWSCPACSKPWTESERHAANLRGILAHHGQEVTPEGTINGPAPATRTLGFRWSAVDNEFVGAADIGGHEWRAAKDPNHDNAERELKQFVYATPADPPEVSLTPLDADAVTKRTAGLRKGICPAGCAGVSIGIDTGRKKLHWVAMAWLPTGGGRIIEYGTQETDADRLGTTAGLVDALRKLKAYFDAGWQDESGQRVHALQVWIDSGWHEHVDAVYLFCGEANKGTRPGGERYRPSKGHGDGQRLERYWAPKRTDNEIRYIGPGYHLSKVPRAGCLLVHVNADAWKSNLHERLNMPPDSPQAVLLYATPDAAEHREFSEHLTAERQVSTWSEGRGEVVTWERIRRQNHFLDAGYVALAAGDLMLSFATRPAPRVMTLAQMAAETQAKEAHGRPWSDSSDGRPWLACHR